ncbi:MAG: acyltransferase family protein [Candidatus Bathyarchaeota archaeon]|nr:acyltransferase family protein [Candidatus Bathyarchaeota archaeon]
MQQTQIPPKPEQEAIPVDLIRVVAIAGVLLLHAANDLTIQVLSNLEIWRWWIVDIYQSVGRMGVPLFVMLSGALLLAPSKHDEGLGVFFRKRFVRIGLPFLFWGLAYFLWDIYVEQQQATQSFLVQGVLTGPYFQFWYLYMLMGLYLLTPLLRLMVARMTDSLFKYLMVIWFIGSALVPLIGLLSNYQFNSNLFAVPGYVGYFVLGAYLVNVRVQRRYLVALLALGIASTAVLTFQMARTVGGGQTFFFQEYLSPTMILSSIAFFLLLNTVKGPTVAVSGAPSWRYRLLALISANTLAIYLFHMMIMETFWKGYLGLTFNGNTLNSIVGVPLMAAISLLICLGVIVPLKKVPFVCKLIG